MTLQNPIRKFKILHILDNISKITFIQNFSVQKKLTSLELVRVLILLLWCFVVQADQIFVIFCSAFAQLCSASVKLDTSWAKHYEKSDKLGKRNFTKKVSKRERTLVIMKCEFISSFWKEIFYVEDIKVGFDLPFDFGWISSITRS